MYVLINIFADVSIVDTYREGGESCVQVAYATLYYSVLLIWIQRNCYYKNSSQYMYLQIEIDIEPDDRVRSS